MRYFALGVVLLGSVNVLFSLSRQSIPARVGTRYSVLSAVRKKFISMLARLRKVTNASMRWH